MSDNMTAIPGTEGEQPPWRARRLVRNFSLLFSSNVLGQLFGLLAMVHLARAFGPALFGVWNLALTWVLYFQRAGELGLEVTGIRRIARSEPFMSIIWAVLNARALLAVSLIAVVWLLQVLDVFPHGSGPIVILLSLTLVPMAFSLEWVFEGHQEVGVVSTARILKGLLFAVLVVGFVADGTDMLASAWYYAASVALPAILVFARASRRFKLASYDVRGDNILGCVRESLPVGFATILVQYSFFAGTIVVSYMLVDRELGLYTAAHRLVVFVWAYGIVTSNRVLLPQLSKLHKDSEESYRGALMLIFRALLLVALPIGIVLFSGGRDLAEMLYGTEFQRSGDVLRILGLALVVAVVRSPLEVGLIASQRQHLYLLTMGWLAVLYTGFSVAGVTMGGIMGAAWASLAAESACLVYVVLRAYRRMRTDLSVVVIPPVLCAALVCVLVVLLGVQSWWQVSLVALPAYLAALGLTGVVKQRDLSQMFQLIKSAASAG
jgi:O-antigen/teichoic acid export membrane protein